MPTTVRVARTSAVRHARWARCTHWIIASSVLALTLSGGVILMAHPRLYWGEVGNALTPALFELPISRNHRHGGWTRVVPFSDQAGAPVSSSRTYEIFNQNGWGRSLHFLAAWILVLTGTVYLTTGIATGHFRRHLLPGTSELTPRLIGQDLGRHLRLRVPPPTGGPHYGLLQKCAYTAVVFVALPLTFVTGLTMSPAVTAAYPFLLDLFGGMQTARTLHFFLAAGLVVFAAGHVFMIMVSGFTRHMRAMTVGD